MWSTPKAPSCLNGVPGSACRMFCRFPRRLPPRPTHNAPPLRGVEPDLFPLIGTAHTITTMPLQPLPLGKSSGPTGYKRGYAIPPDAPSNLLTACARVCASSL
jgi:hypothetical protein